MHLHRFRLPALVLLLGVGPALAQEPNVPATGEIPISREIEISQQTASAIAEQLQASGQLRGFRVEVSFGNGTAELAGYVGDTNQRDEAVRLAQSVPGVSRVISRLTIQEAAPVAPTQFLAQEESLPPPQLLSQQESAPPQETVPRPRRVEPEIIPQEPLPSYRSAVPANGMQSLPPRMPPHAWPTYAPYNNFSRVAYPQAYPPGAFPYIGPVYPYPKVPLGWRSVKLEWDDGFWWLSSHAQQRDWWYLRYW